MSDSINWAREGLERLEAERAGVWERPNAPPDVEAVPTGSLAEWFRQKQAGALQRELDAAPHNQTTEVADWYRGQYKAMQAQVRLCPISSYIAGQSSVSLQTPRAQLPDGFFDHYPFGWMGA